MPRIAKRYQFTFLIPAAMIAFMALLTGCSPTHRVTAPAESSHIRGLKLLGQYVIPYNMVYKQTTVGGLSGIDYDPVGNVYYIICDDRSAINPARFYTAKISFTDKGIDSFTFTDVKYMVRKDGRVFPNNKQDRFKVPDPESLRYNAPMGLIYWSSEGERIVTATDTVIQNPSISIISTTGNYIDSLPLPSNLYMHTEEKGPRQNSVLEGLSFANDYRFLYASVEEPLYEDGPRADTFDTPSYIRLLKYDLRQKQNVTQYAYKLDPVAYSPTPPTGFKINGVPEILAAGENQLLVMERSFSTGRAACTIRLFLTDLSKATDVKGLSSLKSPAQFVPCQKQLLLNMDSLGIYIDNVEGMTWGPRLKNKNKTLILIADNNFSVVEKSQVFLFEVLE